MQEGKIIMEDDPRGEPQRTDEANRLYWHSDLGVNQIAEEMGISKGALYTQVNPLAAEIQCPRCDTELVYPNRTARDRGFLSCPNCGFEEELSELEDQAPPRKRKTPSRAKAGAPRNPEEGDEEETDSAVARTLSRENTRVLVGSGLIALAAGLILTRWLRRD